MFESYSRLNEISKKMTAKFVLILLFLSSAVASSPIGSIENWVVTQGSSIILNCSSFDTENTEWKWYHDKNFFSYTVKRNMSECPVINKKSEPDIDRLLQYNNKKCLSIIENAFSELRLYKVDNSHAGNYTCVASNFVIQKVYNIYVIGSLSLKRSGQNERPVYNRNIYHNHYYPQPIEPTTVQQGTITKLYCSIEVSSNMKQLDFPRLVVNDAQLVEVVKDTGEITFVYDFNAVESKLLKCTPDYPNDVKYILQPEKVEHNVEVNGGEQIYEYKTLKLGITRGGIFTMHCRSFNPNNENWRWYFDRDFNSTTFNIPIIDCSGESHFACKNTSENYVAVNTATKSVIQFLHLDFTNSGKYSCVDSLVTTRKTYELMVLDDKPPTLTVNGIIGDSFEIIKGEIAVITCSANFSFNATEKLVPELIVSNAEYTNHTILTNFISFTYKTLVMENQTYTCYYKLPQDYILYTKPKNASVRIEPIYCPENMTILGNKSTDSIASGAMLICVVSANPPSTVYWENHDINLRKLVVPNYAAIGISEPGYFSCKATPIYHSKLGECTIPTSAITIRKIVPPIGYKSINYGAVQGSNLTIRCTSYYIYNNNWKWFHNWGSRLNGLILPLATCKFNDETICRSRLTKYEITGTRLTTSLFLSDVDSTMSGNYTCFDGLLTVWRTYNLFVTGQSPVRLLLDGSQVFDGLTKTIKRGTLVTVQCQIDPHNQSPVPMNAKLSINDTGHYRAIYDNTFRSTVTNKTNFICSAPLPEEFTFITKPRNISITLIPMFCPENMVITKLSSNSQTDNIRLLCNVAAEPPVQVKWISPNGNDVFSSEMNQASIEVTIAGLYQCRLDSFKHTALGSCNGLSSILKIDDSDLVLNNSTSASPVTSSGTNMAP